MLMDELYTCCYIDLGHSFLASSHYTTKYYYILKLCVKCIIA